MKSFEDTCILIKAIRKLCTTNQLFKYLIKYFTWQQSLFFIVPCMLYGSEAWCLREKEMAILRRTERAMIRAMCVVKLLDRRNSEELLVMFGIKESLDRTAKASSMWWYGLVLRKEDENVIVKALKFEASGSRERGRPKQMEKASRE